MLNKTTFVSLILVAYLASAWHPVAAAPRPLRKSEILALVAGGSLPENIVSEIRSFGLSFRPDDNYKSLLKTAGADPRVLAELDTAKISAGEKQDSPEDHVAAPTSQ